MINPKDRKFIPMTRAGKFALLSRSQTYELRQNQEFPAVMMEIWGRSVLMVPTDKLIDFMQDRIQKKEGELKKLQIFIGKLKYNLQSLRNFYDGL